MWDSRILVSFYNELEKIAEGPTKVVITSPAHPSKSHKKEALHERAARRAKGFIAGALPTSAGIRYLVPRQEEIKESLRVGKHVGQKMIPGLHPSTHSKLQAIAGLGAGILGAAYAGKDKKPSRVIVQL